MGQTAKNLSRLVALIALAVAPILSHAAEPPPLEAYGDLPGIEDAAISPAGEKIALVATVQGKRRLLLLDPAMKLMNQATIGELKIRGLEWVGEETVLLTYSETEKLGTEFIADRYEAYRTMIIPAVPDGKIDLVFNNDRRIVTSIFGRFGVREVQGQWRGYFGGVQLERGTVGYVLGSTAPSLFEVSLPGNDAKRLAEPAGDNTWRDWLIDGNGRIAATLDMDRRTGDWTIRQAGGKIIARGNNPAGDASLVSLGTSGETLIYAAEDAASETTRWYELPLTGVNAPIEIFADTGIDAPYIDRWNGRLIGYTFASERHFFDAKTQSMSDKIDRAFKNLDTVLVDGTRDFGRVLVQTSGNRDSGSWYLVDLNTLRAEPIGVERPLIPSDQVGAISLFDYTAADGLEMDGVLTVPPGKEAKNLPVVVFPHGGPSAHDEVVFDWWAQAFASRGYAVFQPNFRGSTNRGEAFADAGDGEWGRKMQTDISDGLAALAAKGIVDPKRACIMGASYGGYAALAGVTLQQGLYRCAVAVAPVSDLELMYETDYRESGTSRVVKTALLRQLGERSKLDDISPRKQAARASAPILLIHGREDTVVPFKQSEVMADALKDARKPYKLVDLEAEDHWLTRSKTRKQMLGAAMAFVLEHNPPN